MSLPTTLLTDLQTILSPDRVSDQTAVLDQNAHDESSFPAKRPDVVVWPARSLADANDRAGQRLTGRTSPWRHARSAAGGTPGVFLAGGLCHLLPEVCLLQLLARRQDEGLRYAGARA